LGGNIVLKVKLNQFEKTRFWGRDTGREIREKVIDSWLKTEEDTLLLDFTNVEIVDFSFSSEVIAVIISRLSGELFGKHVILTGLNSFVKENVAMALEKADVCSVVWSETDNVCELIGKCSEGLLQLFTLIRDFKKTDSPSLASKLNTTVQVVNNRLRVLTNLGLVKRVETTAPTGGKQYEYYSII